MEETETYTSIIEFWNGDVWKGEARDMTDEEIAAYLAEEKRLDERDDDEFFNH